jgi:hypothetical protein
VIKCNDPQVLSELEGGKIKPNEAFNKLFKNSHQRKEDLEKNMGGKKGYFLTIQKSLKVPNELIDGLMTEFGIKSEEDEAIFRKHFATDLSIHDLRKLPVSVKNGLADRLQQSSSIGSR